MSNRIADTLTSISGFTATACMGGFIAFGLLGLGDLALVSLIGAIATGLICVTIETLSANCQAENEEPQSAGDSRMYYMGDDMSDEEWADYLDELSAKEDWA